MKLQRLSNEELITLSTELGGGGEGKIYQVESELSLVAKIYHPHKLSDDIGEKLKLMLANPPVTPASQGVSLAWPVDLLICPSNNKIIGFLMPLVSEGSPIHKFYTPKDRRQYSPFFNYLYLHRTARNLASLVHSIHQSGYVIGDVNESNILVTETALVRLVDTDSFQVADPTKEKVYRCPVGKPEFTPPELQGTTFRNLNRTPEHDLFGLAVLIFQLLMEGTHPFDGVFEGKGETPSKKERILNGHFPYGRQQVPYRPKPLAPSFNILHPTLQNLFIRCFVDGHYHPRLRPNAQSWVKAIDEAENSLITCSVNQHHLYGEHLKVCPWCEMAVRLGGRDSFSPQPEKQKFPQKQIIPSQEKTLTQPFFALNFLPKTSQKYLQKITCNYLQTIPRKTVTAVSAVAVTTVGLAIVPRLIPSEEIVQLALNSSEIKRQIDALDQEYTQKKRQLEDLSGQSQFFPEKLQSLTEQVNELELELISKEKELEQLSFSLPVLLSQRDQKLAKYEQLSSQIQGLIEQNRQYQEAKRRLLLVKDLVRVQKHILGLHQSKQTDRHRVELIAKEEEQFKLETIISNWQRINGEQKLRELSNVAYQVKIDYDNAQKNLDAQQMSAEFTRFEVENLREQIKKIKEEIVLAETYFLEIDQLEKELLEIRTQTENLQAQYEQSLLAAKDPRVKFALQLRGDRSIAATNE